MTDETVQRLDLLDQYVQDLQASQAPTLQVFSGDKMLRRFTERMLHMAVDTAIQIGIGILTEEGCRSPENYRDVFIVLGEHRVLSQDVVGGMTAMVEFRNLLVYEHESVDGVTVYGFAKRRLLDLRAYSDAIRSYLQSKPAANSTHPEPLPPESMNPASV